jgi:hypothetical protein
MKKMKPGIKQNSEEAEDDIDIGLLIVQWGFLIN